MKLDAWLNPVVSAALGQALRGAVQGGGEVVRQALQAATSEGLGMVIAIRKNDTGEVVQFYAGMDADAAFDVLKKAAKAIRQGKR